MIDTRTPAERKRHWMIDALFAFGLVCLVMAIVLTFVLWLGSWPDSLTEKRLDYIAAAFGAYLVGSFFTAGAFALGGPVGRWSAKFRGAELSGESKEDRP